MQFSGPDKEISLKRRQKFAAEAIIEYLSDPDNPIPKRRSFYAKILKCDMRCIRSMFSIDDLVTIENAAIERRRNLYHRKIARVDDALFKVAEEGDVAGIKLVYQRFEGWGEKTVNENNNTITLTLDPELKKMLEQGRNGTITVIPESTTEPLQDLNSGS